LQTAAGLVSIALVGETAIDKDFRDQMRPPLSMWIQARLVDQP